MKLSDYVIDFLARRGVTHVFGMSGGAAVHRFDSLARHPAMDYVCATHEQCAAMAADGYARSSGRLGVAITTSGPGATNLLTGVCCSYYDSVPTLLITGQVATHRLKGERPVRQVGFQETDVISIFRTVTKYAAQICDPGSIRYHLEKAVHTAFEGRPGPVLIDLPDDLQRAEVDPDTMEGFAPDPPALSAAKLELDLDELEALFARSQRPVLVLGGGLKTPPVPRELLDRFVTKLGAPVLLTWAGVDLLPHDHPLHVGPFGVYGPRAGNFTVQNADLILCIGTRLSQNITGGILNSFARAGTIAMVDVDPGEMNKFDGRGIQVGLRIQARAEDFLRAATARLKAVAPRDCAAWLAKIRHWQKVFPLERSQRLVRDRRYVDAYDFLATLSAQLREEETIFVDTGGNLTWTCNGLTIKRGQRVFSAWNNTPMGYALPAAIGAAFWNRERPLTCIIGDGGLMLCLGELATVAHHQLPIRILLFNNHCHGIQKQTLQTWLGGSYEGVDPESGLAFPDFEKVGAAMGLEVITIDDEATAAERLAQVYARSGPVFCNVEINPDQKLYPVVKFGAALENQLPSLDEKKIKAEMLVEPFAVAPARFAGTGTSGV